MTCHAAAHGEGCMHIHFHGDEAPQRAVAYDRLWRRCPRWYERDTHLTRAKQYGARSCERAP
jgi:hypothetical protein